MANVYVGVNNWDEVNWYLQEGYAIRNPNGLTFPGYFTLGFDLEDREQCDALRKLTISARQNGIRMTTDDPATLMRIMMPVENPDDPNVRVLSYGIQEAPEEAPTADENTGEVSKAGEKLDERREQLKKCNAFFMAVANELKETHRIIGSSLKVWGSACLIPKGTEEQVSYYGKPLNSLRVACNWNWRAALKRCKDEKFIQCVTPDLPWCRKREAEGMASKPIWGNMVGYFDRDQKYHCVYGEKFNRETRTWEWVEGDPKLMAQVMKEEQRKLDAEKALQESLKVAETATDEELEAAMNAEVQIDEL